jgi:hypothetical protein
VIGSDQTGLDLPFGIALNQHHNIYYVTNQAGGPLGLGSVTAYKANSRGNVEPLVSLESDTTDDKTKLAQPAGIVLDADQNIYVANIIGGPSGDGSVTVYGAGSDGNVAPIATITGSVTGLDAPVGITLDRHRNIYVANLRGGPIFAGSLTVYKAGSNGNVSPLAEIAAVADEPDNTQLLGPLGVALDSAGNLYVTNEVAGPLGLGSVNKYRAGSDGNVAPIAVISAAESGSDNTQLINPVGIALDAQRNIYVSNQFGGPLGVGSINAYKAGSDGNAAPIAHISGDRTGLNQPGLIAIGP